MPLFIICSDGTDNIILFFFFHFTKVCWKKRKKNMILYTNKMELKTKITINICIITNSSNNKAIKLFDKCKTTMMLNAALPNFIVATRIATHWCRSYGSYRVVHCASHSPVAFHLKLFFVPFFLSFSLSHLIFRHCIHVCILIYFIVINNNRLLRTYCANNILYTFNI